METVRFGGLRSSDGAGWSASRFSNGTEGQILVETAITLPLVIFLVLIVIQLAFYMTTSLAVNYAAYAGARAAVVHVEDGEYERVGIRAARIVLAGLSIPRALLSDVSVSRAHRKLTVDISYPFPWIIRTSWWPFKFIKGRCVLVPEIRY